MTKEEYNKVRSEVIREHLNLEYSYHISKAKYKVGDILQNVKKHNYYIKVTDISACYRGDSNIFTSKPDIIYYGILFTKRKKLRKDKKRGAVLETNAFLIKNLTKWVIE